MAGKAAYEELEQRVKALEKERTQLHRNLESLWNIVRLTDADYKTLCDHVLVEIMEMTESQYAFYGFMNEDESEMRIYSWSNEALEECKVLDKPMNYPIARAGIWADAVREKRALMINDFLADHPGKKGLPEGHVRLTRLLSVPIFSHGRIAALVAVANKQSDYVDDDIIQIEAFATGVQVLLDRLFAEEALQKAHDGLEQKVVERTNELMKANERLQQEIGERKRADEVLRESEKRYRMLIETMGEGLAVMDENMLLIFANDKFCKMLGYTLNELIGRSWTDLHDDANKRILEEHIGRCPRGEHNQYEIALTRKDGWQVYAIVAPRLIFDREGLFRGSFAVVTDITERKRFEEALRESEHHFRELFDHMSSGVAVYETKDDGRNFLFKDINKAGERIGNVKREEISGKSVVQVFPGVKEFGLFDVFQRVWRTGKPEMHPISLYKDDRILRWVKNYVYKLPSGEIVSVFDDVTEQKRMEEKLRKYHEQLEKLVEKRTSELKRRNEQLRKEITERKEAENALQKKDKELEYQAQHLKEVNTALKVLIEHREEEKRQLEKRLVYNVKKLLMPYIGKLENSMLDSENGTYLSIIKSNLKDLLSPFVNKLSSEYVGLTPTEIQIADLIKHGKTSKEIASFLNVSFNAVSFHRKNIRKKLGLANKKANLISCLQSLSK